MKPTPVELAQIAAAFVGHVEDPMLEAMHLYVEATEFLRDLPEDQATLVRRFGSEKARLRGMARTLAAEMPTATLLLEPRKGDDEARGFLAERGLSLKTARAVLDNFRRHHAGLPQDAARASERPSADSILKGWKRADGTYAIPEAILDHMIASAKERARESKRKGVATRNGGLSKKIVSP